VGLPGMTFDRAVAALSVAHAHRTGAYCRGSRSGLVLADSQLKYLSELLKGRLEGSRMSKDA